MELDEGEERRRRREEEETTEKRRKAAGEVLPVPTPQRPNGKCRGRMEGSVSWYNTLEIAVFLYLYLLIANLCLLRSVIADSLTQFNMVGCVLDLDDSLGASFQPAARHSELWLRVESMRVCQPRSMSLTEYSVLLRLEAAWPQAAGCPEKWIFIRSDAAGQ